MMSIPTKYSTTLERPNTKRGERRRCFSLLLPSLPGREEGKTHISLSTQVVGGGGSNTWLLNE